MASTRTITIYIIFLLMFNLMVGYSVKSAEKSNVDEETVFKSIQIANSIKIEDTNDSLLYKLNNAVITVVSIPFIILESLIYVINLVGAGFSNVPTLVNTILILPMGLIVMFNYIIPMFRGN